MLDIYLIRHAHVDYSPGVQITAHNPLTPLGHRMAARLGERCAEWNLQHLFVSPMLRAQQTADAISARLPHLPRTSMAEFAEMHRGDLQGFPGKLPPEDLNTWDDAQVVYAAKRTFARAAAGWEKVRQFAEAEGLERLAIVSHFGAINALLHYFLGHQGQEVWSLWFDIDWTATCLLRYTVKDKCICWINDASHVRDLKAELALQG